MTLTYIVAATFLGGLISVLLAAALSAPLLGLIVRHLVSLSTGVLLGTALLHVLPEAFGSGEPPQALFLTLLGGLLFFFLLEKAELYRHGHHHEHDDHDHHHGFDAEQAGRGGWSVLVGDSIHNFCDGVLIAAAFLADPQLGIVHAGLLGTVLFGETLGLDALLGMALIVGSGMVAARLKPAAPAATPTPHPVKPDTP